MNIKRVLIIQGTAFFLFAIVVILSPSIILAHPGNTDNSGCHTCWTNCPAWGLSYGEYHCHTPKYDAPLYDNPSIPICPLFSSYDYLTKSCKCLSGYVVSGDKCISQDQQCQNLLGYNSSYNILTDKCECSYGSVFDSTKNSCVSEYQYCSNHFGFGSSYDSLSKNCECRYGYVFNKTGTKCISEDDWCQDQFGLGSEYDSIKDTCICSYGYKFVGNECTLNSSSINLSPARLIVAPTPTPKSSPSIKLKTSPKPTFKPILSPSPIPNTSVSPTIELSTVPEKYTYSGIVTSSTEPISETWHSKIFKSINQFFLRIWKK